MFWTKLRGILDVGALVAVIALSCILGWTLLREPRMLRAGSGNAAAAKQPRSEPPLPSEPISVDRAPAKGPTEAKVVVVEYSEFQCPYCGTFARETFAQIDKAYIQPGRIEFVFRHFPLDTIHANAVNAARAAECALGQGRFWEMHDLLFKAPVQLELAKLTTNGRSLGLGVKFDNCMKASDETRIRQDAEEGRALGVTGTPTFFIGRRESDGRVRITHRLTGAQPFVQFRTILDSLLSSAVGGSH